MTKAAIQNAFNAFTREKFAADADADDYNDQQRECFEKSWLAR